MFGSLLVANRGEIAVRILRSAKEAGLRTVAVYSQADREALHVRLAEQAVCIGPAAPKDSYLRGDRIIEAARETGAEAIHPGYGFLAENPQFARQVSDAALCFVGPSPQAMEIMGDKLAARRAAIRAGVPLIPGIEEEVDLEVLGKHAASVGYPVMLKAVAGGGGKGIRIVHEESMLVEAARLAAGEAESAFGDARIYLEKLLERPRHVEIQIMADQHGNVASYGERECSVQRRHQKLIEESPSLALDSQLRSRMEECAKQLARSVDYSGAGTVEFLVSAGEFYFLEMNTRLQVEHAITEERFAVDLVKEQLRIAAGEKLAPVPEARGHAIEVRINAEDPVTFFPSLGKIEAIRVPTGPGLRFDSALYVGMTVSPHYDSMLAKLIVRAGDRQTAIKRMCCALEELHISGIKTSVPAIARVLRAPAFLEGDYDTSILENLEPLSERGTLEMIAIAAALARHKDGRSGATSAVADPGSETSPWLLSGRVND